MSSRNLFKSSLSVSKVSKIDDTCEVRESSERHSNRDVSSTMAHLQKGSEFIEK